MTQDRDQESRLARSDNHNTRGIQLADRGWLDEALNEFRKAIELDPESAHARDNMATVLAEKGELLASLREYIAALNIDPESPTAHYNLACFLATHGRELAVREYQHVSKLEFDYPEVHLNLGLTLAEQGRFEEAIQSYQTALELDPEDPVARHELATVLMDLARHAEAIPHLRAVVKKAPDGLDAWIDLGISYASKGFYDEAGRALKHALSLDGTDVLANYHMAALHAVRGDNAGALEHLGIAATTDQERVAAWVHGDRFFDSLRAEPGFSALFARS